MKRRKRFNAMVASAVAALAFGACDASGGSALELRAALRSGFLDPVSAEVFLEGPDGSALSGAVVTVTAPSGATALATFSYTAGAYRTVFEPGETGLYRIEAKTVLRSEILSLEVPHTVMNVRPLVTQVMDDSGHAATSGEELTLGERAAIAWTAISGASVYVLTVVGPDGAVFRDTVAVTAYSVPATVLSVAGAYTVSVQAQAVFGDPLFKSASYSSASVAVGPAFHFDLR